MIDFAINVCGHKRTSSKLAGWPALGEKPQLLSGQHRANCACGERARGEPGSACHTGTDPHASDARESSQVSFDVESTDEGPGIADVDRALLDG
jgi:hypothetical protein